MWFIYAIEFNGNLNLNEIVNKLNDMGFNWLECGCEDFEEYCYSIENQYNKILYTFTLKYVYYPKEDIERILLEIPYPRNVNEKNIILNEVKKIINSMRILGLKIIKIYILKSVNLI